MTTPPTPSWLRCAGLPRRLLIAACAGLIATAAAPALTADAAAPAVPPTQAFSPVFSDDFTGTAINKAEWAVYNNPTAALSHSAKNAVVHDGLLSLNTAYDASVGKYTTAGVCLCPTKGNLNQTYGEWDIRARVSAGDSRALAMLWPLVGWPPEIDFVEMGGQGAQATRQQNTQSLHYGTDNKMVHSNQFADFTQWHTIGVQWGPGFVRYLLDGQPSTTIAASFVPAQPMRLGLDTSPNLGGPTTQPVTYDIDWVKQYAYTGGAGAAPTAPTNVVAAAGDTSAAVSWTAPANTGNSLLTGYTITAEPGGRTMTVPRSGNNDPSTAATFTGLTPGVSYSFAVTANNPFGSSISSVPSAAVTVSGTAPSVTQAPSAMFTPHAVLGSTAASTDAAVRVTWATSAGSTAVCQQQVTRRNPSGATSPLKASATATSLSDRLPAAGSVSYSVAAVGCNGLSSGAVPGPAYRYAVTQQNASGVTYSGTWSTSSSSVFSGGSVAETRTAGAAVSFPVSNASAAALVVRSGPKQSSFKVYVDGTLVGTVRATASTVQNRLVAFTTSWATPGSHTIKVVNNASSSATPLLDVDALLSLSR
jgi:beta-glucanase (GH16 family)